MFREFLDFFQGRSTLRQNPQGWNSWNSFTGIISFGASALPWKEEDPREPTWDSKEPQSAAVVTNVSFTGDTTAMDLCLCSEDSPKRKRKTNLQ